MSIYVDSGTTFLREKSKQVFAQTNVTQLWKLLDKYPKTTTQIDIHQEFHGEIDLSILNEHGFHKVEIIRFLTKGTISNIVNIPTYVKHIVCNDNQLRTFTISKGLETLELKNNQLSELNLPTQTKSREDVEGANLMKLNVSNNLLTMLPFQHLPNLVDVNINGNDIDELDLSYLQSLKHLSCANNPNIRLLNIRNDIDIVWKTDLEFKDDIHEENGISPLKPKSLIRRQQNKRDISPVDMDPDEAIRAYFDLKSKHEFIRKSKIKEYRKQGMIREGSPVSKSHMKINMKNNSNVHSFQEILFSLECAVCSGIGRGIIFEESENFYKAKCGSMTNPCELNIVIQRGQYMERDHFIQKNRLALENAAQEIIQDKAVIPFIHDNPEVVHTFSNQVRKHIDHYSSIAQSLAPLNIPSSDISGAIQTNKKKTKEEPYANNHNEYENEFVSQQKRIHEIMYSYKQLLNQYQTDDRGVQLQSQETSSKNNFSSEQALRKNSLMKDIIHYYQELMLEKTKLQNIQYQSVYMENGFKLVKQKRGYMEEIIMEPPVIKQFVV